MRHYETEEISLNISEHFLFEVVESRISASVISLGERHTYSNQTIEQIKLLNQATRNNSIIAMLEPQDRDKFKKMIEEQSMSDASDKEKLFDMVMKCAC